MTKRVRVNIRTAANTAKVRREKRNGRDVVIVPSATLPDGIVMNGIRYPADEIEKSYLSLNRTPAPAGHPTINGRFVSASDPEGINIGWFGAWNENVRREGGRVFLDKVIDVARANESETGRAILNAIDKGEPIHTSTGLYCNLDACNDGEAEHIARNIVFDHDAVLLNEEGAATPEQGVGMLVNAKGEAEEIEVINSVWEDAERELEWAADMAVRAVDRMERASIVDRLKTAIMEALRPSERETSTNEKEIDMAVSDEQFKTLSDEVKTLSDSMGKIGETIANAVTEAVKPLADHVAEVQANAKAAQDAEKAELVGKIVKANVLTEAVANTLSVDALKELAAKAQPKGAAPLSNAFGGATNEPAFKLPKAEA
ncbi:hypothetical protein [Sagittula sp. S175]|uniref:hypothetical protein n=1 Tax=Sagittula sp. S175 TaxID=3415129 RepID=UPI003C7EB750